MRKFLHIRLAFGLLLLMAVLMQSCATTYSAHKCNGQKSIRTPMGPM